MSASPSITQHPPVGRPASPRQVVRSQARLELRLMMSNGEQILLTMIIPVVLLLGLSLTSFVNVGGDTQAERIDLVVPGVIALAIMSSAFTAQAIATGFDRRSEAIKFLGTTPLSRTGLLTAKIAAVSVIQVVQLIVLAAIGLLVGWRPEGPWPLALLYVILGTAAFTALGLALAGVLRAEITLAAANALYLLMLLAGGIVIPPSELPGPLAAVSSAFPSAGLADGLRLTLSGIGSDGVLAALILLLWTGVGALLVRRTFRWTS